ncbi:alpha/beta hydrolase [Actinoplanes sp. NBRC 101535]|uniref:alpha/beta fold hydrolase n=1 Tax=Actinoplanes sp. NBRC 101535 TaxID=3032196 RepID=UPI0024A366C9|nr:alpha/beta hydrolase [Actinoplanes sp. NBRC 101535]GLY04115.1 alpha/beta hydrolase [Actinoplanes sp. NBRC 101535]
MPAVTVDGVRLFTRRFGDPSSPPLVVIHGGPTWDHSFLLPAVAALADVAQVVLFDLPGCGRSHRTPPAGDLPHDRLQPEALADTVAGLISTLGHPNADVLGFSFGGRIAMRLVQRHPTLVNRLILASTTAYTDFDPPPVPADRLALSTPVSFDDPLLTGTDGALSRAMAHGDAAQMIWQLDRLDEWRQVLDRVRFTSDYNEMHASGRLRPAAPPDIVDVLRAWARPALILHGAHDLGFPVDVAHRLHAELTSSRLAVVPDAAHMAHFDNPDAWLAAVRTFLSATPSTSEIVLAE